MLGLAIGTTFSIVDRNAQIRIGPVVIAVLVLASLVLQFRAMLVVLIASVLCVLFVLLRIGLNPQSISISGIAMIVIVGVATALQSWRRDRLGLKRISAESVIGLIRDRLSVQAELDALPAEWQIEVEQRPADGAAICGDFVANRVVFEAGQPVLHLAVIDVSGSGITAGPRALLLSGAVGGLLGTVAPEDFLLRTNDYLLRQRWSLGFASAVYLRLDLYSGEYVIRVAGHPPALQFRPGHQEPWRISDARGTVLGVLPGVAGGVDAHVVESGDALFLYTDGVVESPDTDLQSGIEEFRRQIEVYNSRPTLAGAASHILRGVSSAHADDRTVVMIRRLAVAVVTPVVAAVSEGAAV